MRAPNTSQTLLADIVDEEKREQAWRRFFSTYGPCMSSWLREKGETNETDIQDVVQDSIIAILVSLKGELYQRNRGRFRSYLSGVVRNKYAELLRRRASNKAHPVGGTDWRNRLVELEDPSSDKSLQLSELLEHVHVTCDQVRSQVEPALWEAFSLCKVDGMSPPDVARQMGVAVSTVYLYLAKVLEQLQITARRIILLDPVD